MSEQDVIPGNALATTRPDPMRSARPTFEGVSALLHQPAVRRALPALAAGGGLLLTIGAWWVLQSPTQLPVYAGLSDGDKAAVSEALQSGGVAFAVDSASGNITVAEGDVHKARILLAGQGLPKAAPAGEALIGNLPLGASRALEDQTLQGAREADLARTIEAIQSVKSARVMLAQGKDSPFIRDEAPAAASVMLTLENGRALDAAQVKSIRFLVASSVPGLSPAQVSVVDQSGALLSDTSQTGDDKNFDLQLRNEERLRKAVVSLLTPILGQGNFSTEVHADVDFTESQSTRESFPKDDNALRSEQGNVTTMSGGSGAAVGIPGAVSNQPPQATQVATTPGASAPAPSANNGSENAQSYSRSFDVGREIAVTHQPVGKLRRVTVAVAVKAGKKAPSARELAEIESLVKGAVGFDATRGDSVAVSSRKFVTETAPEQNFWDSPWFMTLLRQLGGLLAAALVFFFIGRPLLKRMKAANEKRASEAETETAFLKALGNKAASKRRSSDPQAAGEVTLEMIESAPAYEDRAALVRRFVQQDPDRAFMVMRNMMKEPANG
jgi:flagellar M-ring protein FliF